MDEVNRYIAFRLPNWLDYAAHMARIHGFKGWEHDLLNDVLIDLLQKDPAKLKQLVHSKTGKVVNGAQTTELDKFVLKMLQTNAFSPLAPFRKNTLGNKIIDRPTEQKVQTARFSDLAGIEIETEDYDTDLNERLDEMHTRNIDRLLLNEFGKNALDLYSKHYLGAKPLDDFTEQEQTKIKSIERFLTQYKKTLFDD